MGREGVGTEGASAIGRRIEGNEEHTGACERVWDQWDENGPNTREERDGGEDGR